MQQSDQPSKHAKPEALPDNPYLSNFPYLFSDWDSSPSSDPLKAAMLAQLDSLNSSRSLLEYTTTARRLLNAPPPLLTDIQPPQHQTLVSFPTSRFFALEALGATVVPKTAFVLVAGGLGERLGSAPSTIKLNLTTESATGTSFLSLFVSALQALHANTLCIMTSDATHSGTLAAVASLPPHSIKIYLVKQQAVPAIANAQGHLAKQSTYALQEKPHGHGDVHVLLHTSRLAETWRAQGLEWVVFFQDSNPQALRGIVPALGVSLETSAPANVVAVPRLAKSAAGMLCSVDGKPTVNLEYNLVSKVLPNGDINEPSTGFSAFPGNTNQLILALDLYCSVLAQTQGRVPEFVNPKINSAGEFEKPTRLESLMQDILCQVPLHTKTRVTMFLENEPASPFAHCLYAPSKNDRAGAARLRSAGAADGSALSSELAVYAANFAVLKQLGLPVSPSVQLQVDGARFDVPPRIVLLPSAVPIYAQARNVFPTPEKLAITGKNSLLTIKGPGKVIIYELHLEGCLHVEAKKGVLVLERVVVRNRGTELVADASNPRGYRTSRDYEARVICLDDEMELRIVDD